MIAANISKIRQSTLITRELPRDSTDPSGHTHDPRRPNNRAPPGQTVRIGKLLGRASPSGDSLPSRRASDPAVAVGSCTLHGASPSEREPEGGQDENHRRAADVENTRASRVPTWKRHRQLGIPRGCGQTRGFALAGL